ncbi:MAG: group 1 truncated hemoglobin, partial [Kordiimonas sp.]
MKYFNKAVFIALTLIVSHKTHATDLALYEALGKEAGITKIVSHALDLSFEDPRTKTQFAHSKKDRLVKLISEQICELVGGPCEYKGLNMIKT